MLGGRSVRWWLAAVLGLAATNALADSYRLAFSKSENIEIFVEHAAGTPWCAPHLSLRAVHGGSPDTAALARLLPKLGALLNSQCPKATALDWVSTDTNGRPVANGTSTKADLWALRVTPAPAVPPVAAAPPTPLPEPAPVPTPVPIPKPEPPTPMPQPTPAPMPRPEPVPSPPPAPIAAPVPAPAAAAPVAPVAPVAAPAAQPTPAPVATPSPVVAPMLADFDIGGWKPGDGSRTGPLAEALREMKDQNGCRVLTRIDTRTDMNFIALKSVDLTCGSDGYASGPGRLTLERSDGVPIARTSQLWFSGGIPFTQEVKARRLAAIDKQNTLWFHLASDVDTRTHFLLRARATHYGGIGVWQIDPQIDALTDQADRFRQAEAIRHAVDAAIVALDAADVTRASRANVVFSSDFERGTAAGDANHLLYSISVWRGRDRRSKAWGSWQYNLQQANNYLFQRDARLARQKQMEEQRAEQQRRYAEQREAQRLRMEQARVVAEQRRNLQTYQQLVDEATRDPQRLRSRLESDLAYQPLSGGTYAALVAGGKRKIQRIVRVDGSDGPDAEVDWPYAMRLTGKSDLASGWYRVDGEVTLDAKRRDDEGLPLTLLSAQTVMPCKNEGCTDLLDPLAVTRMTLGQPEWTPEAAQAALQRQQ